MVEITLSRKQQQAFELLSDPVTVELLFGGGAGGGKSWLVSLWAIIQCKTYPGIKIGLGRKDISLLRGTTALTILNEVHPLLGITEKDFRYQPIVDPGIFYSNGSAIVFKDLAPAPTDPDFNRLGSLNLTHVIIEEAGEAVQKAANTFSSRKNRLLNREYGISGKTVMTCNPSQNFLRDDFYEPWLALGAGDLQTWEFENDEGDPAVVELPDGSKHRARRGFIKSLPTDNPFLSSNYIQTLNQLSASERKRLLHGDWDYNDDQSLLFKTHLLRTTQEAPKEGRKTAGCDPSRGGDGCIFVELTDATVTDIVKVAIPKGDPHLDIGGFVAEQYIEFCRLRNIGSEDASVDVVGIGASVQDSCNRLGFHVRNFNAGSNNGVRKLDRHGRIIDKPRPGDEGTPLFNNIRSQNLYDMAQAAHEAKLLFLEDLPYFSELKRDMASHKYETRERQVIVESKDKLKVRLGRSPDYLDALQAAWWAMHSQAGVLFRVRSA